MVLSKKILFISDNKRQAKSAQLALDRYDTEICSVPREGIRKAIHAAFDLIIIDSAISDPEAGELCRTLKENLISGTAPLSVTTDFSDPENVVACIEAGAVHFVITPLEPATLLKRTDHLFEKLRPLMIQHGKKLDLSAVPDDHHRKIYEKMYTLLSRVLVLETAGLLTCTGQDTFTFLALTPYDLQEEAMSGIFDRASKDLEYYMVDTRSATYNDCDKILCFNRNDTEVMPGDHMFKSFLSTPLTFQGDVFGQLVIASRQANFYDDDDRKILDAVAAVTVSRLKN